MTKKLKTEKSCAHCKVVKKMEEFHKRGQGRASWCKLCANICARDSKRRQALIRAGINTAKVRLPKAGEKIINNKKYNFTEVICKPKRFTNFI